MPACLSPCESLDEVPPLTPTTPDLAPPCYKKEKSDHAAASRNTVPPALIKRLKCAVILYVPSLFGRRRPEPVMLNTGQARKHVGSGKGQKTLLIFVQTRIKRERQTKAVVQQGINFVSCRINDGGSPARR